MFSRIASHTPGVGGSHGQDVINGFKVLCGHAPAMSVVGIVKGLTGEDAKFVDTQCSWSAAHHWASWWLRSSHLQI